MMTADTQAVNLNASVECVNGTFSVGGLTMDYATFENCWYPQYVPPYIPLPTVLPTITTSTILVGATPNKLEQAFKIVALLVEKKRVKDLTVASFISLVNEIAGAL